MISLGRMSCFECIKIILDDLYGKLPEKTRDVDIQSELEKLSNGYKCLRSGGTIDYSKLATQFAYLYCYVTAHANTTYELVKYEYSHFDSLFNRDRVEVVCLGGGPGSDILGIIKFMEVFYKKTKLEFYTFDKEEAWVDTWKSVFQNLQTSFSGKLGFRYLDVCDPSTWAEAIEYSSADLYTMSFFLSEVCSNKERAQPFFLGLFENAKVGALFLFIDNDSVESHLWFDSLIATYNWEHENSSINILEQGKYEFSLEYREQKEGLEPYYSKFCKPGNLHGGNPRLKTYVNCRICCKQ